MELKMLDWDTAFFEKKIFSLYLTHVDEINEAESQLVELGADTAYIFLPVHSEVNSTLKNKSGIVFYDHKLTYSMALSENKMPNNIEIQETNSIPDADFIALAISSGIYSRFALDPALNHKFEELYELWLRNSLNKKLADKVFVSKSNDFISSFVTCKIKGNVGNIGLIATHTNYRGKSLGRNLINHVHQWYAHNGIHVSEVVTQKANSIACTFYENYGFKISNEELVYHWHIKN